ncbi:MAG: ribonuclease HIII [bacterium]|nr:ribonuclease HIII [bacterium]
MNVVIKVSDETKEKMIDYYKDKVREKTPPYAVFQAQEEDTIITLYTSGKCMFQGVTAYVDADMWKAVDGQSKTPKIDYEKYYNSTAVGSDEVGTGDYFGPIVVTASLVKREDIKFLEELGIKDSKKLTDEFILNVVPKIISKIKYKSTILTNEDYNKKYSKETNMNKIKAIMHNKVLYSLLSEIDIKPDYIIIDEFAKEERYYSYIKEATNIVKDVTFITKAEDKNLAVAASSMISRYIFLKEFDKLCDTYKMPLPKGAGSNVDSIGEELVEKYGNDVLDKVAKKNFSNTKRILKTMIF